MEYTEEQVRAFKEAFSTRRRNQFMVGIPLIVIVVAFVVSADEQTGTLFGMTLGVAGPIFLGLILASAVFSFKNWRCPACNRYLGKVMNPRHCHSCGVELR